MAPELVREESYTERVDVWSVGVVAFVLLTGKPPFMGRTKSAIK
jgi:serine/threonine protein kinase